MPGVDAVDGGLFVRIRLSGSERILRLFDMLSDAEMRQTVKAALQAGARVMLPVAKANAPKRTGALRKALTVRGYSSRSSPWVRARIYAGGGDYFGDTWYAGLQEYGWHVGVRKSHVGAWSRKEAARRLRLSAEKSGDRQRNTPSRVEALRVKLLNDVRNRGADLTAGQKKRLGGRSFVPGKYFMRNAARDTSAQAESVVQSTFQAKVEARFA